MSEPERRDSRTSEDAWELVETGSVKSLPDSIDTPPSLDEEGEESEDQLTLFPRDGETQSYTSRPKRRNPPEAIELQISHELAIPPIAPASAEALGDAIPATTSTTASPLPSQPATVASPSTPSPPQLQPCKSCHSYHYIPTCTYQLSWTEWLAYHRNYLSSLPYIFPDTSASTRPFSHFANTTTTTSPTSASTTSTVPALSTSSTSPFRPSTSHTQDSTSHTNDSNPSSPTPAQQPALIHDPDSDYASLHEQAAHLDAESWRLRPNYLGSTRLKADLMSPSCRNMFWDDERWREKLGGRWVGADDGGTSEDGDGDGGVVNDKGGDGGVARLERVGGVGRDGEVGERRYESGEVKLEGKTGKRIKHKARRMGSIEMMEWRARREQNMANARAKRAEFREENAVRAEAQTQVWPETIEEQQLLLWQQELADASSGQGESDRDEEDQRDDAFRTLQRDLGKHLPRTSFARLMPPRREDTTDVEPECHAR